MTNSKHHVTESVITRLKTNPPRPTRGPLPTAPIYALDQIGKREVAVPVEETVSNKAESQMFFKGKTAKLDQDPFLQRLSRLS